MPSSIGSNVTVAESTHHILITIYCGVIYRVINSYRRLIIMKEVVTNENKMVWNNDKRDEYGGCTIGNEDLYNIACYLDINGPESIEKDLNEFVDVLRPVADQVDVM